MGKGLVLLALIIFIELFIMISIGKVIGALGVLALLIIGVLAGTHLIRREQAASEEALRAGMGASPAESLRMNSPERMMLNFFAGVLLIIPGFLSDIIAILLLLPPVQKGLSRNASAYMQSRMSAAGGPFGGGVFRFTSWSSGGFSRGGGHMNAGHGAYMGHDERVNHDYGGTVIDGEARDVTGEQGHDEPPSLVIDLTADDGSGKNSGGSA